MMQKGALITDMMEPRSPETSPVVETWELGKVYRTGFWLNRASESLKNFTLRVYPGETFGLLGPNGAGKTTLFKILLGIIRPSSGRARVLGKPPGDRNVKQRLGYLPENAYFYDYLTGWEFLQLVGDLFLIPRSQQRQRITQLLEQVGLAQETAKKKPMGKYSKGMLQRIGLAQALINDPDVVFLDEPMSGLDPVGRYRIREIILSLKEQGKTIFFNSHILTDVEQICDRVAILALGELLYLGTIKELGGVGVTYRVIGKGGEPAILSNWLENLSFKNEQWEGQLTGEPESFLGALGSMGATLISMSLAASTLEEFFIKQLQERSIDISR